MEPTNSPAPAASPPSRSRRLFQISLRTLFILFTIGCIWLGIVTKQARDQREAVNRILELGGSVNFDYEYDSFGKEIKDAQPPGWRWLRRRIGDEYFRDVVQVTLDKTMVTDDDLRLIGKPTATKTLALNWTKIGDAGLAYVVHLRRLKYLGLAETRITDEGLRHIESMDQLESLILGNTSVGDGAIDSITKLQSLETLNLQSTRVTSRGIKDLSQVPNLKLLCISDTNVDDAVVGSIGSQNSLAELILTRTNISGEGLLRLRDALPSCGIDGEFADLSDVQFDESLPFAASWQRLVWRMTTLNNERRLKLIEFSGSEIADRHLPDLHKLKNVEVIDLRDTKVTAAGVEALRKALPKCQVAR